MGIGAFGNPQAAMEAAVLVHNITRIVQVTCYEDPNDNYIVNVIVVV